MWGITLPFDWVLEAAETQPFSHYTMSSAMTVKTLAPDSSTIMSLLPFEGRKSQVSCP
jgi:hypothetical protein